MKCARCSAEVPSQSQFCLRCGTPLQGSATGGTRPAAAPTSAVYPPAVGPSKGNQRTLIAMMTVLALAVLGLGAKVWLMSKPADGANNHLVTAPGDNKGGALVQAPGETNPGAPVQAPSDSQPPKLPLAAATPEPFPADVDDYLKFLKDVERRKQDLIRKQTGDALLLLTQAKALSATIEEKDYNDAFKNMRETMDKNNQDWQALTGYFNSKQPPPPCVDLRNKYLDQMGKIQATIFAVNDALSKVSTNPSEALHTLTDMQSRASGDVDASISAADDALGDVCSRFHLHKDFDIKGDSGANGLMR